MDPQTRWAVDQIQKCLRTGNAAAVIELGEHLLASRDDDLEVFMTAAFCVALAYERLGDWRRAQDRFDQCLVVDPENPTLLAGRARVLAGLGKDEAAAVIFERLAKEHDERVEFQHAAGSMLLRTGNVSDALGYLSRARMLDPSSPQILNELGTARLLTGDLEAALDDFRAAVDRMGPADRELALRIRENIEEVQAAMALQGRAVGVFDEARVIDLNAGDEDDSPTDSSPAEPRSSNEPGDSDAVEAIRTLLLSELKDRGCRARQIVSALHLWSDFAEGLTDRERMGAARKPRPWIAAVYYTLGRLEAEPWAVQRTVATTFGVSAGSISRRFVRLCRALTIEIGDPRYCAIPTPKRTFLIDQICAGRDAPDRLLLCACAVKEH